MIIVSLINTVAMCYGIYLSFVKEIYILIAKKNQLSLAVDCFIQSLYSFSLFLITPSSTNRLNASNVNNFLQ